MASLKLIKNKIKSVQKTQKVTKAMEAVSAAKMRKAQLRAISGRAYARAAVAVLSRISGLRELANHSLMQKRDVKKVLYVVITSDKGLAGALNSAVLKATLADINARGLTKEAVSVIAVGRKASDFFASRGFSVDAFHPNTDQISSVLIQEIVSEVASRFESETVDEVKIAYQNFRSTFEQIPILRVIFPLSLAELQKVVEDIIPAKGAFSHAQNGKAPATYVVEPAQSKVLNVILPKLAGIFVYHALIESQASEHSARKSASDKAEEMRHSLTLGFNKARQAAITREVSEITGGMEAMAT